MMFIARYLNDSGVYHALGEKARGLRVNSVCGNIVKCYMHDFKTKVKLINALSAQITYHSKSITI